MGIARLTYFTLDKNPIPGFFKGLPSPAAALLVLAPLVILDQGADYPLPWLTFWSWFAVGTMLFGAVVMNVYPIHFIHMGRAMSRKVWLGRMTLAVVVGGLFTPFFGYICLASMLLYVASPLVTGHIRPEVAARERPS
jgi:phosphatidylserine synthase